MNRFFHCFLLQLFTIIVLAVSSYVQAAPIVIGHTRTNINELLEADIVNAKNKLHIVYRHTSHGSQVTDGMSGLVDFANGHGRGLDLPANILAWNNGGTAGALDMDDSQSYGDVGSYPNWVITTHNYLGAVNPTTGRGNANSDVNVFMWSWCGQASELTEQQMINQYLGPMTALENEYWGVKFVYMTGHLDGSGANGNLNLRNNQIRQYCQTNNKILYDFADIESYDPDGSTDYMALLANDNCDYDSDGDGYHDRNWATTWQAAHTENVDWYDCYTAHSQPLNGNLKGYAAWALWTDIATSIWNGPGSGSFNLTTNWTNKTVPNGVDEIANFTENVTAPSTVTMNSSVTLGTIKFKSSLSSYSIAGADSLTLQTSSGNATINVVDGNHSIDVPVVMNSDTLITGAGRLNMSEGISGNHTLTVLGDMAAKSINVNTLTIGSGAKITINPIAGGPLSGAITAVPEPSSLTLFSISAIGLLALAWQRKRVM